MTGTFIRTRFTWLAYFLLAFFGYFLNILGPITPFLKDELNLSYTVSSLHFTAFAVGILIVGLFGHLVIERVGRGRSLWIGAFGMSFSVLLLLVGRSPVLTIGASFLMGVIGSLILAVVPSALSDEHGERRAVALSEANVVSSLIATAAPLLVGIFAHNVIGWRLALWIAVIMPLLMLIGFGKVSAPATEVIHEDRAGHSLPLLYWVYWAALVLCVSVEFCMIFWSADYLENGLGMAKADAAQAVSLFLGAMIVGRLAGSRLVQYFSTPRLVSISILIAGVGFLIFWKGGSVILGLSGLFITGLGVASLYPLVLALAIGSSNGDTVQAGARATLASGAAILALPLALGRLADIFGIQQAYGVVALLLVGALLIIQITEHLMSTRQPVIS